MSNPNINIRSITVAANQQTDVNAAGTFLLIYSATGSFQFSLDGGSKQDGTAILTMNLNAQDGAILPSGQRIIESFRRITFYDTSGNPNTIKFIAANAAVEYANPTPTNFAKDAATFPQATGSLALAAGGVTRYSGVGPGGQQRKFFIVTNRGVNAMEITDDANAVGAAGNLAVPLPGNSLIPICIATSGALKVYNPSGAPNNYSVVEIFYV